MSISISDKENENKKGTRVPFLISTKKVSLSEISPYLLNEKISEHQHIKNIGLISKNFTVNRAEIQNYVLGEELVSSYTYFYLPTNIPKFYFLLDQLPEAIQEIIFNSHFVDFGSGPGTYSYALSNIAKKSLNITCFDSSLIMQRQAEKLLRGKFPENTYEFKSKVSGKIENSVLFFGNSINEIGIQKTLDIINIIDPKLVLFIEPGTSELFLELQNLRSELCKDFNNIYPCPTNNSCPSNWCHQVLRCSHELDVERLSQLVSLDRKTMPMTAHAYLKNEIATSVQDISDDEVTITRYLNETKFSFLYEACKKVDSQNLVITIEILKKKMTKVEEKTFKNLNIGEKIKFTTEKVIGTTWRGYAT